MARSVVSMVLLLVATVAARVTTVPALLTTVVCGASLPAALPCAEVAVLTMASARVSISPVVWLMRVSCTDRGLGPLPVPTTKLLPLGSPLASPSSTSLNCRNLTSDS